MEEMTHGNEFEGHNTTQGIKETLKRPKKGVW